MWLVANSGINSDEAVVGLMANGALHGHLTTFYWGQDYGGVEYLFVAALFKVFGAHAWLIRATACLLSVAACVVVWRLGRCIFGNDVGVPVAVVLIWIWPESNVRNSLQEFGFRGVVLVCGLLVLLAAVRIATHRDRLLTWALLGVSAGVGWWASPEILYFLVPAAPFVVMAVVRSRPWPSRSAALATGVVGAVVGALPWLYTNVGSRFASLRIGQHFGSDDGGYGHRVTVLFAKTLPIVLGTRVTGSGAWVGGGVGPLAFGLVVAIVVAACAYLLVRVPRARILVAFVVTFMFLYPAMPTGYWLDGRFAVYLAPVVGLVVLGAAGDVMHRALPSARARRRAWVAVGGVILVAAGASTVVSLDSTTAFSSRPFAIGTPSSEATPAAVAGGLARSGVHHAYASYWVAYVLDFAGAGVVAATPPDAIRSQALYAAVAAQPRAAWLFTGPSAADRRAAATAFPNATNPYGLSIARFTRTLASGGIRVRELAIGPMVALVPSRAVTPPVLHALTASRTRPSASVRRGGR
jgi:hypothetical protein